MVTLITGDREWTDWELIRCALESAHPPITCIIEGECRGADRYAQLSAKALGIPVDPRPADWEYYGKGAGPIRNAEMLSLEPQQCFAFHDDLDASRGTADMVRKCQSARIPVCLFSHNCPEGRWL